MAVACHHPPIPHSPGGNKNWIERIPGGHIPKEIECVARALYHSPGRASGDKQKAYQMAVGVAEDWAAGRRKISKEKQAKYVKAVAEWQALRARAHAQSAVDMANPIDLATWDPAKHPRDKLGRWRLLTEEIRKLNTGETLKVGRAFEVHKLKDTGPRKFRVTMKVGKLTGGRRPDQHVYEDNPGDAADTALGTSLAEAESQVRNIRAGKSQSERRKGLKLSNRGRVVVDLATARTLNDLVVRRSV